MLDVIVAGYGIVGKKRCKTIRENNFTRLVAVCDRNFENDGEFPNGIKYFRSFNDLLNIKADILIVCLSNDVAAHVTAQGLKKGYNVFCEKPPARNIIDLSEVIEVKKKSPDLKLMYGFNHRFHDSVEEAYRIIISGELGKIINMKGEYGKSKIITFNQPDWRTKRSIAGGGVLLDQGIHMLDLMMFFGGKFEKVYSYISNSFWKFDVEDNAYILMKSKDGVVAMLNSSATQWRHRFRLDINLEKGSLILSGILSGSKSYGEETLTVIKANPDHDNGDPIEFTTKYNKDNSWEKELKTFVESILNNQDITSGHIDDAVSVMTLIQKIYFSDEEWRKKYNIKEPE